MKILLTLFIFTIIFIFPIPLKFYIFYNNDNYYVKLYSFTLLNNKLSEKKKEKKHKKATPPKDNKQVKKKKHKKQKLLNIKDTINYSDIKNLIHKFHNLKFKPFLILNCEISYSFADAARTAVAYGSLCIIPSILHFFISIIFNIKKYNFKIIPVFKDDFILELKYRSIIFISLANIIYMIFIFLIFIYSQKHKNKKIKNMNVKN